MTVSRRTVLAGLGAALLPVPASLASETPHFVSACRLPNGDYAAAVLGQDGQVLFTEVLDGRGHDAALRSAPPTAVMFARRPGRFALVIDLFGQHKSFAFAPPADRRFAGHGFFAADGKILYATENDFGAERGVIGLYDATDRYRRIGEFATHGIGPHEALLLSDGRTIAVANGGIVTHPDYPRLKLNLASMEPSLVLLDAADGTCLATSRLGEVYRQLSIRHMAEVAPGRLWFGTQHEGPKTVRPPLVGVFDRDRGLRLIEASAELTGAMDHYVGSVAATRDGQMVTITSPRGGLVTHWDTASCQVKKVLRYADACGAAPAADGIAVTSGTGGFLRPNGGETNTSLAFDNHLAAL